MTPTKRLVLALFKQAVKDFKDRNKPPGKSQSWTSRATKKAQQDAIDFLCADVGEWKQSREAWAQMIGLRIHCLHEWAKRERATDATH